MPRAQQKKLAREYKKLPPEERAGYEAKHKEDLARARNGEPLPKKARGSRPGRAAPSNTAPPLETHDDFGDEPELSNSGTEAQTMSYEELVSGVKFLSNNATAQNNTLLELGRSLQNHTTTTNEHMESLVNVTKDNGIELEKYKRGVGTKFRSLEKNLNTNTGEISKIAADNTKHSRQISDLARGAVADRRNVAKAEMKLSHIARRFEQNDKRLKRLEEQKDLLEEQVAALTKQESRGGDKKFDYVPPFKPQPSAAVIMDYGPSEPAQQDHFMKKIKKEEEFYRE